MARRNGRHRARSGAWQYRGGGCVMGRLARGVEHPCDDEYENVETGERALLLSTEKAHDDLPDEASSIAELARRPGVVLERQWFPEDDDE